MLGGEAQQQRAMENNAMQRGMGASADKMQAPDASQALQRMMMGSMAGKPQQQRRNPRPQQAPMNPYIQSLLGV